MNNAKCKITKIRHLRCLVRYTPLCIFNFAFSIKGKMNGDSVTESIARLTGNHATQHEHPNHFFLRDLRVSVMPLLICVFFLRLLVLWLKGGEPQTKKNKRKKMRNGPQNTRNKRKARHTWITALPPTQGFAGDRDHVPFFRLGEFGTVCPRNK